MNLLLILALFFLAAVVTGIAVYFFQRYHYPEPSLLQVRLQHIRQERDDYLKNLSNQLPNLARLLKGSHYANEEIGKFLEQYSFVHHLRKLLLQAGMSIPVDRFLLMFLALPLGSGLILSLPTRNTIFLLGGVFFAGFSYLSVRIKKGQRLTKFTAQLPDAINMMTSALRAGHSFQSSLVAIVSEMPEPISAEFRQVLNDINLGIPVKDALGRLSSQLDTLPDVRMFTTAVIIQREAGGNLAEILDKLSLTIRERFKLKGQIAALTGQSRLTGYVLGCAPIAMLIILTLFFNNYVKPLYTTTLGHMGLLVAAIMQIIGFFVMKRIIDIRI